MQIQQGQIKPVYFFHGEEGFHIEEAITRLKKAILTSGLEDLNYHLLSGPSARTDEVIHLCQTLPIFCTRRLVVVREVEAVSGLEGLIPYLDSPSTSTCLVLVAWKMDPRKRHFIALKTKCTEVLFNTLNESQIAAWIKDMTQSMGIILSPEGMDYLKERLGNDLYQIRNELEKISLAMTGPRTLEAEDLQTLLTGEGVPSVFEWLEALRRGDHETALQLLTPLLDSGEYPLSLLGLLLSHLRRAARAVHTDLHGLPTQSHSRNAASPLRLGNPDLKRTFALCLEADSRLKGSRLSPQLILEDLVLNLCGIGKKRQGVIITPGSKGGLGGRTSLFS